MSIYVGNLSYEVTQEDLNTVFAEYGSVKRVQLPTDRETGRMRGFGFVEMGTDAEETAAIEALDGAEWMGRALRLTKQNLGKTEVRLVVTTAEATAFPAVTKLS